MSTKSTGYMINYCNKISNSVSLPYSCTALRPPLFPSCPRSSTLIYLSFGRLQGSLNAGNHARRWTSEISTDRGRCRGTSVKFAQRLLIDSMRCRPCDVSPHAPYWKYFEFLAEKFGPTKEAIEEWQTLVHVCRRWRRVVFGSPHRLDLRLLCSNETPARDTLYVWPALPLFIACDGTPESVYNIVAALERSDRVCDIGPYELQKFGFGKMFGSDAGAIPRAHTSEALVEW